MNCQPYRPSNGTDGSIFVDRWCNRCARDQAACDILDRAFRLYASEPGYPTEWTRDAAGRPVCTAHKGKP